MEPPSLDGPVALGDADTLAKPGLGGAVDDVEQARAYDTIFRRAEEPRQLGRYVVLDSLGQGGMGVVLRAYDRALDRPVALKVLHQEIDSQHAQRLRREAQALAKLSHPNVVQVYEVGEVEGQTFVAMELVKGQTLREWMQQRPRPDWRVCVELFVQLGAGLSAAHERGLVHRDFKPGNAIIDEKGRPRVLDFGLARRDDEVDDEPSVVIERARTDFHAAAPLETSLTMTGAVLGTPAYMPPEQMGGLEADARSDQFSFCVSLHEAVYGERPYAGSSMMAIMVSMREGAVRPAPRGSDVPVALRRALVRGLAVDPVARWPSMEALLEELRRLAAPRRRRWMVLGVTVGLVAVGGGLGATRALEWRSRCTGARKQLEGVWDEGRRQEVKAAILGTELSYAAGTWERVEPQLDAYAEAWVAEHTEACEATRSRDEQSEEEMSLRMGCLRERSQYLRATVGELAHADATVVEHAVQAVTSLPGLERCRDLEALRAEVPPPEDPAVAERVAAQDERLVAAKAKDAAGKYAEGLRLADEVEDEAATLGYEPLMARVWLLQGWLRVETGDYEGAAMALRQAYGAAMARRMTAEAASASSQLLSVLGDQLGRPAEAERWLEHAEPLSRAAGTDRAIAMYLTDRGLLCFRQGKYDDARNLHERALAIDEKALGPDHLVVASSLMNLANAALRQGKHDEARRSYERVLVIREEALGPEHPLVAQVLNNVGYVARLQGQYEDARASFERALAIDERALGLDHPVVAMLVENLGNVAFVQGKNEAARGFLERALATREEALGPEHPDVADSLINLGNVSASQGRHEEARSRYARALAIKEKVLGPEHPDVALVLSNLSYVARARGKQEAAVDFAERALAIYEKGLGPENPEIVHPLVNLGHATASQGKHADARAFFERALAIETKVLGPDHPDVASSLTGLGLSLLGLAEPGEALAPLERALTIHTTHEGDPFELARTRFALARGLWDAPSTRGSDRPRARTLAEQARDAYAAAGEAKQTELARLETWLAEHRLP